MALESQSFVLAIQANHELEPTIIDFGYILCYYKDEISPC
jgi:hypothetical protein